MTTKEPSDLGATGAATARPDSLTSDGRRLARLASRSRWPLFYFASIAAVIWWYEIGSAYHLPRTIEGDWREVRVESHVEEFTDNHVAVEGGETWYLYPQGDAWVVNRSRISVKPAKGFYLVSREFAFDWGKNTRSTEYIMYHRGDQLFMLHGLARLDPSQKCFVKKLRRVEGIPDGAEEAIEAYMVRNGDGS